MQYYNTERLDQIHTVDDLRIFIREVLCAKENLLSEQFPVNESLLKRGDKPCGMQFLLFGPRSIRLGAIWASDHNVLYFYAANGERYLKIPLQHRIQEQHEVMAATSS